MAATFHTTILASNKKIYDGDAESLIAPGELGYLGILAHHAPFMTKLIPGKITVREPSGKVMAFDSKTPGFLEVVQNKATILVD